MRKAADWCILRTSGGRTLALAKSLADAGFDVWTPRQTLKRTKMNARARMDGTKQTIEIDIPIMPTIVFARRRHLAELVVIASTSPSRHPPFSIFRHYDRTPLVADCDLNGMRLEENAAADALQVIRDCETREEERRARALAARNERERRKALRSDRRSLTIGDKVGVKGMPAFAGLIGVVESSDRSGGTITFGGRFPIAVESWQVIPYPLLKADIAA